MLKSYLITILSLFAFSFLNAQNSAVNKADRYRTEGQLKEAKQAIDEAVINSKTKDNSRTWFVYGQVYHDISTSTDQSINNLDKNAAVTAIEAYNKVKQLENENNNYYQLADAQLIGIWGDFVNKGAMNYQSRALNEALSNFEVASKALPYDTTAFLYIGLVAQENGAYNKDLYPTIFYLAGAVEDYETAVKWSKKAVEKFPNDNELKKQEINALILAGETEKAKNQLAAAIEREPNNANLYFNQGFLYEELGDTASANMNYKKAIQYEPNYFDAIYNLGVIYYNTAAELYKESANLSLAEYNTKGEELENTARQELKKALPYMEKACELRPNEPIIWNTLSTIYTRLSMDEKAEHAYKKYRETSGY